MMRRNIFLKVLQIVKLKKNEEINLFWVYWRKKNVHTYFKVFFPLVEIMEINEFFF